MDLRPYQSTAVQDCRGALGFLNDNVRPILSRLGFRKPQPARTISQPQNALLVLPTGGGKTVVFADVARREAWRRILIAAHRKDLIRQASAKLTAAGVPHGIIAPSYRSSWIGNTSPPVLSVFSRKATE